MNIRSTFSHRNANRHGFTLVELAVVLVIIGVLAALGVPRFLQSSRAAREAEAGPILKQVYTLQVRHYSGYDRYAADFDSLEGAAAPVRSAKYYQFGIEVNGTTFTTCARPRTGVEANAYAIDQDNRITTINPADCTPS